MSVYHLLSVCYVNGCALYAIHKKFVIKCLMRHSVIDWSIWSSMLSMRIWEPPGARPYCKCYQILRTPTPKMDGQKLQWNLHSFSIEGLNHNPFKSFIAKDTTWETLTQSNSLSLFPPCSRSSCFCSVTKIIHYAIVINACNFSSNWPQIYIRMFTVSISIKEWQPLWGKYIQKSQTFV